MKKASVTVTNTNTALSMGSGSLPVFATPAMVALMEEAACRVMDGLLSEGITSVGTAMSVNHLAATPVGMTVTAEAELLEQDGRKYVFRVTATDEKGLIGEGRHERFAVDKDRFLAKTNSKLEK